MSIFTKYRCHNPDYRTDFMNCRCGIDSFQKYAITSEKDIIVILY